MLAVCVGIANIAVFAALFYSSYRIYQSFHMMHFHHILTFSTITNTTGIGSTFVPIDWCRAGAKTLYFTINFRLEVSSDGTRLTMVIKVSGLVG